MGDLVLTDTEIEPVMTKLLDSGIDITALHNHLLRANPATYYMHVHGHGDPAVMAIAIRAALAESKTPFDQSSAAQYEVSGGASGKHPKAPDRALSALGQKRTYDWDEQNVR